MHLYASYILTYTDIDSFKKALVFIPGINLKSKLGTSTHLLVGFSERDNLFLTAGSDDTDDQIFIVSEFSLDLINQLFRF